MAIATGNAHSPFMSTAAVRLLWGLTALDLATRFLSAETPSAYTTAQASPCGGENATGFDTVSESFKPGTGEHLSRTAEDATAVEHLGQGAITSEIPASPIAIVSTRSSFVAQWSRINEATGYRLDVSTSSSFDSYVTGYQDLDVGPATWRVVTGLSPGRSYYYRVKAYNAVGSSGNSDVMAATTAGGSGFIINASFDSSITNNANSAAIESMINQAISIYESLFSDPITVFILFRYSTTRPDGTPIGSSSQIALK